MKTLGSHLTHILCKWSGPSLTIVVALGMAMCTTSTPAQSGAGSIQGTVVDPTGAVIPGASVHVVNNATSVATDTNSNSVGFYVVPELFTGHYTVTVTAHGMKTFSTEIELLVAQAAIINPTLTPGAVTERVEVSANTVQLTTLDSGTISSTLENDRINQLPMNGRYIVTLAGMTTPGLESSSYSGPGSRANGLMGEALEYVADGVTLTNREFGGENQYQAQTPDPDSIQEVRIETTNTSAQYTEPGTAILTTKSGSNSLHGSLFETARNNAIGIAKARSNPYNYAAPHYVRNEFGVSAGGPITLPHIYNGKSKSFWFLAYERYSLRSNVSDLMSVPTTAMKGGDFSGLINSAGQLQQLYDPATTQSAANNWARTPFTNNQIPLSRQSPLNKIIYDVLPNPTSTNNPLVTSNLTYPGISDYTIPTITFRLDHSFNENNRVYLRYTQNVQTEFALRAASAPPTLAADGLPANASGLSAFPTATFASALGYTHVFSPTFFAETIVSQQWFGQHNYAAGSPFSDFESQLGLPNNFSNTGMPSESAGLASLGGTQYQYGLAQIISNIDENLNKTVGRHQLQFGARYRHERFSYYAQQGDGDGFGAYATALENPASTASGNYSATSNTGYADADEFLGAAATYQVANQVPDDHSHDMEFDGYFQDNYHVSKSLTVNIGLRYEAHPAAWAKNGVTESFDFKNHALVLANPISFYIAEGATTQAIVNNVENLGVVFESPSQAGIPSTMLKSYDFTFGPRLGVAWQPFKGKYGTVLRGAYGRYIYPMPIRNYLPNAGQTNPPDLASYTQSYVSAAQSPDGGSDYLLRAPVPVVAGKNSSNVINTGVTNAIPVGGLNTYTLNPDFPPDYVTQTNVTIEQAFKGNSALRVTWLYSHATNLDQNYYINNHPTTYAWDMLTGTAPPTGTYSTVAQGPYDQTTYLTMNYVQKSGWSNDNALQATYQRLFHRGVAYQISYVWSKPFRLGGNTSRDSIIYPYADYVNYATNLGTMTSPYGTLVPGVLPPPQPKNIAPYAFTHQLDRFENYHLDTAIPLQHITFNGIYDLPVGRGKRFLGNVNRFGDEAVGGWQIAGDGNIVSQNFAVATSNYGPANPIHIYKHKAPITDCRSGTCRPAYEWFNGYLAPTVLPANSSNANCTLSANNVQGLPANWAPYSSPIDTDCNKSDAAYKYYNGNTVNVTLLNGTVSPVAYAPGQTGTNPYSQTILNGPINWTADLSVFKVFPITEKVALRFNVDAFNAFNVQGYTNPNTTDGTEQVQPGTGVANSANTPRQMQLTLRLNF